VGPIGGSWDGVEIIKEGECGRCVYERENIDDQDVIFYLKEKMEEDECGWYNVRRVGGDQSDRR
jgi:hypothetical protein